MFIESLRMRTKIFLIVFILMSGLFIYGLVSFITIQTIRIKGDYYNKIIQAKDLVADVLPPPGYIIESYLLAFRANIAKNTTELDELIRETNKLEQDYNRSHERWMKELPPGRLRDLFVTQSDRYVRQFFATWREQLVPALKAGDKEKAYQLLGGPLAELYQAHRKIIDEVVSIAEQQARQTEEEVTSVYETARDIGLATWILSFLLGGLLVWWLSRSLGRKLVHMSTELDSIASKIHSSTDQQAEATSRQSSIVHDATTTMNDLNVSFQHTQTIAQESSDRAKNALKVSEDGNLVLIQMLDNLGLHRDKVTQIVEHITRLSQLTRQIHNIASLTSNLTNQTNILALNAAVQAAHVKQYGEGFSVIAGEIRKLADESKNFLHHIDLLSENIQQATDSTIKIVEEGNKTIQEIIQQGQSSSQAFGSIMKIINRSFEGAEQTSLDIKQQGIAVQQVLKAMENVNQNSQQGLQGMRQIRHECDRLATITNEVKEDI